MSFKNSYLIVEDLTPEVECQTIFHADSIYPAEKIAFQATFRQNNLMIEQTIKDKIASTVTS